MEVLILLIVAVLIGLALGSQTSYQPPQITIVQVQPDDLYRRGGCGSLIVGIIIFVGMVWVLSSIV